MARRPWFDVPEPTIPGQIDLLGAVNNHINRPLGKELAERLMEHILWGLSQQFPSQSIIDLFRYHVFSRGIKTVGWKKAGEWAAERLKGSPWEGSAHTIQTAYTKFQRNLPPEHRRPRTYRPHPTRQI
jgi:hypothetical protein